MDYVNLKEGRNDTVVKALYEYMVKFAVLFGADKATASSDMKDVIDFQIEFAKVLIPLEERNNISSHTSTIRGLQEMYPSFPWLNLINNFLFPMMRLVPDDIIHVEQPKFFERLENFLPKTTMFFLEL